MLRLVLLSHRWAEASVPCKAAWTPLTISGHTHVTRARTLSKDRPPWRF